MKVCIFAIVLVASSTLVSALDKPLDFYGEALDLTAVAQPGQPIWNCRTDKNFSLDYTQKQVGDFSLMYNARAQTETLGILPNRFLGTWQLKPEYNFRVGLKASKNINQPISISFIDQNGRKLQSKNVVSLTTAWQNISIPLSQPSSEQGFEFGKVKALEIRANLPKQSKLWIDGVFFEAADGTITGIIEKPVSQRIREAETTRKSRLDEQMIASARNSEKLSIDDYFAKLYCNVNVAETNKSLYEIFTSSDPNISSNFGTLEAWHLTLNSMLFKLYYTFGSKSTVFPGRLEKNTESALLNLLWERTKTKNDIQIAKLSTWWMTGSENHDMNMRVNNLLSSQIFMNEPEYKNRVYPDLGKGAGSSYWFHKSEGGRHHGPEGRASWKDPNSYTAKDHYVAWVANLKEYFQERAARGFFVENASPGYMKYTMGFVLDVHDFSQDPELKAVTKKFMDLYYTEWMIETISGTKGGAKTRMHGETDFAKDSTRSISNWMFGADQPGMTSAAFLGQALTAYRIPEMAWHLAMDREGLGAFEYTSRSIGEEQGLWPRPAGLERTMLCDTDSRLVSYSFITPDYIIGTQMDSPAAIHSHLSIASRYQGIVFPTSTKAVIFPRALEITGNKEWHMFKEGGVYRSVQYKNVLITQQARGFNSVSPDWFPDGDVQGLPFGVYFGQDLDRLVEKGGWIFIQEGNAYVAVRPVKGEVAPTRLGKVDWLDQMATESDYSELDPNAYEWDNEKMTIKLVDKYSPIIFETSSTKEYPNLEAFMSDVLDNEIKLQKTVVPGYYALYYKGCPKDSKELYLNCAGKEIPQIDGEYINYQPAMLFDCPYLKSVYKSKLIKFVKDDKEFTLDFN